MLSKEKIITVRKTICQVKLQNHKWMISFTYHEKTECFYICEENALPLPHILVIGRWQVEDFLEEKRQQSLTLFFFGLCRHSSYWVFVVFIALE